METDHHKNNKTHLNFNLDFLNDESSSKESNNSVHKNKLFNLKSVVIISVGVIFMIAVSFYYYYNKKSNNKYLTQKKHKTKITKNIPVKNAQEVEQKNKVELSKNNTKKIEVNKKVDNSPNNEDFVYVGEYRCSYSDSFKADTLNVSDTEKLSLENLKNNLESKKSEFKIIKQQLHSTYVNKHSKKSVNNYNSIVRDYNRKLLSYKKIFKEFNEEIELYNSKIKKYNSYLETNCSKKY